MSTRALIGYIKKDGKFVCGWQWYNGMKLAPLLRRQFNTIEKLDELISNGVWDCLVFPRDKDTLQVFTEWTERKNSDYYLVPVGKCHLLKNAFDRPLLINKDGVTIKDGKIVFPKFVDAVNQGCDYIYEFNPKTKKWKTYTPSMLVSMLS